MQLKNSPKSGGGIVDLNRAQVEHRASWMALMYQEAENEGFDMESATRKAIRKMGGFHGHLLKTKLDSNSSFEVFKTAFFNGIAIKTFEMDKFEVTESHLTVEFNYCPLLAAWQKLGVSEEKCAKLCDIAMDGDRGIAAEMGYDLELTDTIASGCNSCKLKFVKK
ncbi:L-2-amino-thiazoline-4-carboxylic acid hydrolase [Flavobacterium sandaracinum]|uniref:Elastase-1 n=1 Tax=Flavobacterium sandaracinum TaxID=2541733 RepID=A0A4V2Z2F1_9FLAO|nr:L-2-amino-thiazoline-4-carboxylic acid hydrolase [Flavobacterium sandaracinum]TDE07568.1 hypothetical protein E0F91_00300 [Flavobacterium sandaracinum]